MSDKETKTTAILDEQKASADFDISDAIAVDEQDSEIVVQEEEALADSELVELLKQIDLLEEEAEDAEESSPEDLTSEPEDSAEKAETRAARPSKTVIAMLNAVNRVRRKYGRRSLRLNGRLMAAAQRHSRDMARHKRMSHRGSNGSSLGDRTRKQGYSGGIAENVAYGQNTVRDVMVSWMKSPGHRRNLLNPKYKALGVGYAKNGRWYWTQVFGSR